MQNIEGSNWSPKVKSVYFLGILLFLALTPLLFINGCGGDTNSGDTAGGASLPNLTLTFPDGYSVDRSTGALSSKDASSALTAPAYVTGITLTITGENIETQVFDVPLDTGIVSGTLPPGTYTFSVAVTTSIGLTFTGSQVIDLESGDNADLDITLTVNAPPVITSITISNSAPAIGDTVTANCSATDADGEALTYAWSGAGSGSGQSVSRSISADGTYTFTCTASDGRGGVATASVSATAITVGTPPPAPNPLLAVGAGPNSIGMTWPLVAGATSYNLYYSTTPGAIATGTQVANVGVYNTTFNDYAYTLSGLTAITPYYLVVTAVNAFGEGPPSGEVTATPSILISSLGFTDPILQACVNAQATLNGWTFVSQMTNLDCGFKGISNLAGIEQLTALTLLYLFNNQIVDVTPLSTLPALATLQLWSNNVSNVAPLSNISTLTSLAVGANPIIDVTPLSKLTGLTTLSMLQAQVNDMTPLSNLTALIWLDLEQNNIGGQGFGNVHLLSPAPTVEILLTNNLGMSCNELSTLLANYPGRVDLNGNRIFGEPADVVNPGVTCTGP